MNNVVPKIIKINIVVFFLWYIVGLTMPSLMVDNFLVSWSALENGRFWTLLTSAFSHNMLFHIFINMYVFFGFGLALERVMGSKKFLYFYLLAAVAGSLGHSVVSAFYLGAPELPALGASGAVSAVLVLFALLFPKETIFLFGLIPVPAMFGSMLFVGIDLWGLVQQSQGGGLMIGHGAHLGGAFFGLCYYLFYVRHHQFHGARFS